MKITLTDEAETRRFAEDLAQALRPGDTAALSGGLGAGKTALARALIRALADDDGLEVPSPTFTLAQLYEETRFPVLHADIYRLESAAELEELGLEEARQNGAALVEWAEKAPALWERAEFRLKLAERADGSRSLEVSGAPAAMARLRHSLAVRAFLRQNGRAAAKRRYLQGDASPRRYERLYFAAPRRAEILMDAPQSEIKDKARARYIRRARLAAHNSRFSACAALLRAEGFSAPQIYAENSEETLFLLEDLGDEGIEDGKGGAEMKKALAAAAFLASFHQVDWEKAAAKRGFSLPPYDRAAQSAEADLFARWYLPYKTGRAAGGKWQKQWRRLTDALFALPENSEKTLALRDFHSPNILWQAGEKGVRRIGLIDFQDALLGAPAYDMVSLAQDARLNISRAQEERLKAAYCAARAVFAKPFDAERFAADYAVLGAQRALKILGVFVRLAQQDGKPHYLRHLPRIAGYLQRSLAAPALAPLRAFLAESGLLSAADE